MKSPIKKRKILVVIAWKPELTSQEQKLLVMQLIETRGSFWQSPTGGVEKEEDFAAAALREAQEETGLKFSTWPQYLGLEYEFDGRWGAARERAFLLWTIGGTKPPMVTLDPTEHQAYEWLELEAAEEKVKYPANKEAILRAAQAPSPLLLSRSGIFFQDGQEITNARTVELLHNSLTSIDGHFLVRTGNEELPIIVEDCPRFICHFYSESGRVKFLGGREEMLHPETIKVSSENRLYCQCENGMSALFLSPAYYEITKDVSDASGQYVLHFLGRDYVLGVAH